MNSDFKELLREFNAAAVEYLVVGAHALAAHGHVRATKELDIWVRPDPANARRVLDGLRRFGAPLSGLTEEDLSRPDLIFQIGVPRRAGIRDLPSPAHPQQEGERPAAGSSGRAAFGTPCAWKERVGADA